MDAWTTSVVLLLGRYAIDKGAELAKEAGPKAMALAGQMFTKVLDRIRKRKPVIADEFAEDPETYEKPMEKALDQALAEDDAFKGELEQLWARFEEAAKAHPGGGQFVANLTVIGSGSAAAGTNATSLGQGAMMIKGDFSGTPEDLARLRRLNEKEDESDEPS